MGLLIFTLIVQITFLLLSYITTSASPNDVMDTTWERITFEDLVRAGKVNIRSNTCIAEINDENKVGHISDTKYIDRLFTVNATNLSGTVYFISEWMAPGHMMYDIQLLQVLHTTKVDCIFLRRAPCYRDDFCQGITYWKTFFEGLYTVMMNSAGIRMPIYFWF
jgi:hypothetical protein